MGKNRVVRRRGLSDSSPPPQLFYNDAQRRQGARLFLQSSELGPPPPPHPQASVSPPLIPGGTHSLGEEGVGDPSSDEGTDTVVL